MSISTSAVEAFSPTARELIGRIIYGAKEAELGSLLPGKSRGKRSENFLLGLANKLENGIPLTSPQKKYVGRRVLGTIDQGGTTFVNENNIIGTQYKRDAVTGVINHISGDPYAIMDPQMHGFREFGNNAIALTKALYQVG